MAEAYRCLYLYAAVFDCNETEMLRSIHRFYRSSSSLQQNTSTNSLYVLFHYSASRTTHREYKPPVGFPIRPHHSCRSHHLPPTLPPRRVSLLNRTGLPSLSGHAARTIPRRHGVVHGGHVQFLHHVQPANILPNSVAHQCRRGWRTFDP